MPGIDDVLERLLTDREFAQQLARDPAAALTGYELSRDDLTLLSTQVSFDPGALSLVEERVSKAGMFGLLTSLSTGLGSIIGPDQPVGPGVIGPTDSQGVYLPGLPMSGDPTAVVAPIDSSGLQGPDDAGGAVAFKEVDPAPQPSAEAGGIGGGGGEVSIKEVDPAPQPSAEAGGIGGGGGEVSIKEVDPGAPQGIIDDNKADPPDPDAPRGIIDDNKLDPNLQPAPDTDLGGDAGHSAGGGGGAGLPSPGTLQGFNPQPDPPGIGDNLGLGAGDGLIIQGG